MLVFEKLAKDFAVVHVHGNNVVPFVAIDNVPTPQIIEITYANRHRYSFQECKEVFPTALDSPNIPGRSDLFLGRFAFE